MNLLCNRLIHLFNVRFVGSARRRVSMRKGWLASTVQFELLMVSCFQLGISHIIQEGMSSA